MCITYRAGEALHGKRTHTQHTWVCCWAWMLKEQDRVICRICQRDIEVMPTGMFDKLWWTFGIHLLPYCMLHEMLSSCLTPDPLNLEKLTNIWMLQKSADSSFTFQFLVIWKSKKQGVQLHNSELDSFSYSTKKGTRWPSRHPEAQVRWGIAGTISQNLTPLADKGGAGTCIWYCRGPLLLLQS